MNPIEKILAQLKGLKEPAIQQGWRGPTKQKRKRKAGTKRLHTESKVRRKMAARSNRINRKRVKSWKH